MLRIYFYVHQSICSVVFLFLSFLFTLLSSFSIKIIILTLQNEFGNVSFLSSLYNTLKILGYSGTGDIDGPVLSRLMRWIWFPTLTSWKEWSDSYNKGISNFKNVIQKKNLSLKTLFPSTETFETYIYWLSSQQNRKMPSV